MDSTLGYASFIGCPGTDMFLCSQSTKLWIIMEYLGGGSALDLVRSSSSNEQLAVGVAVSFSAPGATALQTVRLVDFLRFPVYCLSALDVNQELSIPKTNYWLSCPD